MNDRLPGTSFDNPIWHEGWRIYATGMTPDGCFAYSHEDFDGTQDHRCGTARTIQDAKDAIDLYELMQAGSGAMK